MNLKNSLQATFVLLIFLLPYTMNAQGAKTEYYYNPATELSWASCYLYQDGGSRQKIPFLPELEKE